MKYLEMVLIFLFAFLLVYWVLSVLPDWFTLFLMATLLGYWVRGRVERGAREERKIGRQIVEDIQKGLNMTGEERDKELQKNIIKYPKDNS